MNRNAFRRGATGAVTVLVMFSAGCSLFPESMQPINLQKLNRGPGPTADPFYSISDPTPNAPRQAETKSGTPTDPILSRAN